MERQHKKTGPEKRAKRGARSSVKVRETYHSRRRAYGGDAEVRSLVEKRGNRVENRDGWNGEDHNSCIIKAKVISFACYTIASKPATGKIYERGAKQGYDEKGHRKDETGNSRIADRVLHLLIRRGGAKEGPHE